ncbi:hypothetical protein D3C77_341670 [compost metagenome]
MGHIRAHSHDTHFFERGRRDHFILVSGDLGDAQAFVCFEAVEAVGQVNAVFDLGKANLCLEGNPTFDQVHHCDHVVVVHVGAELSVSKTDDRSNFDGGSSH